MAQRSNGTRPKTAQQRRSSGEIDRYHYVDRDIYSRSNRRVSTASHKGPAKKRRKRKKSAGRRVIAAILVLAALCAVVFIGFTVAMGRLNRPAIDTKQYEEQPSAANNTPAQTLSAQLLPGRGEAEVHYLLPRQSDVEMTLIDPAGRRHDNIVLKNQPAGAHSQKLATHALPAGLYLLQIKADHEIITIKYTKPKSL